MSFNGRNRGWKVEAEGDEEKKKTENKSVLSETEGDKADCGRGR